MPRLGLIAKSIEKTSHSSPKQGSIDHPILFFVLRGFTRGNGSQQQRRLVKFDIRAGVPECWLVEPENTTIHVYAPKDNAYEPVLTSGVGEIAHLVAIMGFQVSVDEVFSEA